MKRLITIVGVGAAVALGGGTVAASTPPTAGALTLTPSAAAVGTSFDATLVGCAVGETVTFEIEGTDVGTFTATCTAAGASLTLSAPTLDDTYTITATGATSGATASAPLVVTGGEIPVTGSNSMTAGAVAASLIVLGAALALWAGPRRSRTV